MSVLAGACPFITLDNKFRTVTKSLQCWSSKTVGQISMQLALAREIIHQFEIAQDSRQLSQEELWFKNNLKRHSLALASLKCTQWRVSGHGLIGSMIVMLTPSCFITMPDTGRGRILLGSWSLKIKSVPANIL
jgi:hypothetical protein